MLRGLCFASGAKFPLLIISEMSGNVFEPLLAYICPLHDLSQTFTYIFQVGTLRTTQNVPEVTLRLKYRVN